MTKGQRAMAVAKLYPEAAALKRKGSGSVKNTEPISGEYIRHARTVLRWLPQIADLVMAGAKPLHQLATRISARAIRRAGDLLQEFQSPGGRPPKTRGDAPPSFTQREAAEAAGMSKDQEKQAVRVARVPAAEFVTTRSAITSSGAGAVVRFGPAAACLALATGVPLVCFVPRPGVLAHALPRHAEHALDLPFRLAFAAQILEALGHPPYSNFAAVRA